MIHFLMDACLPCGMTFLSILMFELEILKFGSYSLDDEIKITILCSHYIYCYVLHAISFGGLPPSYNPLTGLLGLEM